MSILIKSPNAPKPKRTLDEALRAVEEAEVKVGHPLAAEGLAEMDQRMVDERGLPIAEGLPWSESQTGLYLSLAGSFADAPLQGAILHKVEAKVNGLTLMVVSSHGLPTWDREGHGAAIGLPSDLGSDAIKRDYLTAWVTDTLLEICTWAAGAGWRGFPSPDGAKKWLQNSCEECIVRTGL